MKNFIEEKAERFFREVNPENEVLTVSPLIPEQTTYTRSQMLYVANPFTAPYYTTEMLLNIRRAEANNVLLAIKTMQPAAVFELVKARLSSYHYLEAAEQYLQMIHTQLIDLEFQKQQQAQNQRKTTKTK